MLGGAIHKQIMRVVILIAVLSLHLVNIYVNKFNNISIAGITTPHQFTSQIFVHAIHFTCKSFSQYSVSALACKIGHTAYMYVYGRVFELA